MTHYSLIHLIENSTKINIFLDNRTTLAVYWSQKKGILSHFSLDLDKYSYLTNLSVAHLDTHGSKHEFYRKKLFTS